MRNERPLLFSIVFLLLTLPLPAKIGNIDDVPAATLLLPYFLSSLDGGVDTEFFVRNASSNNVMARVTLWTNMGFPTYGFDIFLSGHDEQKIQLRDIFADGVLPPLPTEVDPGTNPPFPDCENFASTRMLTAERMTFIRNAHKGQPALGSNCVGLHTDPFFEGYVTVDVVQKCSATSFVDPTDSNYWAGAPPQATRPGIYDNVLTGDFSLFDGANGFAFGNNLVHIEASTTDPLTSGSTTQRRRTFYGLYSNINYREALPTTFAVYRIPDSGTSLADIFSLIVWRDVARFNPSSFPCLGPSWYLNGSNTHTQIVFFDDQENPFVVPRDTVFSTTETTTTVCGAAVPSQPKVVQSGFRPFARATQKVDPGSTNDCMCPVDTSDPQGAMEPRALCPDVLPPGAPPSGWIFLNLDGGLDQQAYVLGMTSRLGRSSSTWPATHLDNAGAPGGQTLSPPTNDP